MSIPGKVGNDSVAISVPTQVAALRFASASRSREAMGTAREFNGGLVTQYGLLSLGYCP